MCNCGSGNKVVTNTSVSVNQQTLPTSQQLTPDEIIRLQQIRQDRLNNVMPNRSKKK